MTEEKIKELKKEIQEQEEYIKTAEWTATELLEKGIIEELEGRILKTKRKEEELTKQLQTAQNELKNKEAINQGLTQQLEKLKKVKEKTEKKLEQIKKEKEGVVHQLLDIKKKDLNIRLGNFRTGLSIKESDLQAKYSPHNYQQILDGSLTLDNLEQLENTIRAVICTCVTETISQEVADTSKKANLDEIRALLTNLNLIKTAWNQMTSEISKENNPLYLEIIDRHSEYRQQVENLIEALQKQQPQTPVLGDLSAVKQQAKQNIGEALTKASLSEADIISDYQGYTEKIEQLTDSQEVKNFAQTMIAYISRQEAAHKELKEALKNAVEVSSEGKDKEEDIFEKRRQARHALDVLVEKVSPEAQQAYKVMNKNSEVKQQIEKLARQLWSYLESNEQKANDPENKEFLEALTSKEKANIEKGTEKYKLYWILQKIYQEFVKSHLDDKKHVKFYPYITVPGTYGHTGPRKITRTTKSSTGKVISSTVLLEGFDFYVDFKRPELQIFATFVHELAHNVMFLKEHKGLLSGDQSHSKPFWESNYANIDSNLAYLLSCLLPEKQKELKNTTDLSTNPDTDGFHTAYCLEGGELEGKARIIKYFSEEEINKQWHSTRQLALGIHDTSMNENLNNWELENRSEADKRWIEVTAYHKSKKPSIKDLEKGKQEYKIYIFFDDKIAPDTFTKSIRDAFGPENGWKGWKTEEEIKKGGGSAHVIDAGKAKKRLCTKIKEAEIKCGCGKEEHISTEILQQEAQIIHNPFPMENPNK